MKNKLHIFPRAFRLISHNFWVDILLSSFCNVCFPPSPFREFSARSTHIIFETVPKRSCRLDLNNKNTNIVLGHHLFPGEVCAT